MKLIVNNRVLDLSRIQVMGILNVTPDSFFDGGKYFTMPKAIDHTADMIKYGATIIDVGGESTRPGITNNFISAEEEAERILPVVQAIVSRFDIFISINTSSALIITEVANMGVHLINDVRSLSTKGSMKAAVDSKLAICLTHNNIQEKVFQKAQFGKDISHHNEIVSIVNDYFHKQIARCELAGINKNKLLLDPGFGFSKSILDNYRLLANLECFHHFNLPLLIGISRKSMLNYDNVDSKKYMNPRKRLMGSIACAVFAAMKGVHIVRVHDVKDTVEALNVIKVILRQDRVNL